MFLKFLVGVAPLVFKNNLRIILGSKSEKFKNIEALKKVKYSYKKEYTGWSQMGEFINFWGCT